jgi:hypothetical protein
MKARAMKETLMESMRHVARKRSINQQGWMILYNLYLCLSELIKNKMQINKQKKSGTEFYTRIQPLRQNLKLDPSYGNQTSTQSYHFFSFYLLYLQKKNLGFTQTQYQNRFCLFSIFVFG